MSLLFGGASSLFCGLGCFRRASLSTCYLVCGVGRCACVVLLKACSLSHASLQVQIRESLARIERWANVTQFVLTSYQGFDGAVTPLIKEVRHELPNVVLCSALFVNPFCFNSTRRHSGRTSCQ